MTSDLSAASAKFRDDITASVLPWLQSFVQQQQWRGDDDYKKAVPPSSSLSSLSSSSLSRSRNNTALTALDLYRVGKVMWLLQQQQQQQQQQFNDVPHDMIQQALRDVLQHGIAVRHMQMIMNDLWCALFQLVSRYHQATCHTNLRHTSSKSSGNSSNSNSNSNNTSTSVVDQRAAVAEALQVTCLLMQECPSGMIWQQHRSRCCHGGGDGGDGGDPNFDDDDVHELETQCGRLDEGTDTDNDNNNVNNDNKNDDDNDDSSASRSQAFVIMFADLYPRFDRQVQLCMLQWIADQYIWPPMMLPSSSLSDDEKKDVPLPWEDLLPLLQRLNADDNNDDNDSNDNNRDRRARVNVWQDLVQFQTHRNQYDNQWREIFLQRYADHHAYLEPLLEVDRPDIRDHSTNAAKRLVRIDKQIEQRKANNMTRAPLLPASDPMQIRIDQVRAILPDLGEGFVETALACFHGNVDETISVLLDSNVNHWPQIIRQLDRHLPRRRGKAAPPRAQEVAQDEHESRQLTKAVVLASEQQQEVEALQLERILSTPTSTATKSAPGVKTMTAPHAAMESARDRRRRERRSRRTTTTAGGRTAMQRVDEYDDDYDDQYDDMHEVYEKAADSGLYDDYDAIRIYNQLVKSIEEERAFWDSNQNTNRMAYTSSMNNNAATRDEDVVDVKDDDDENVNVGDDDPDRASSIRYRGPDKMRGGRIPNHNRNQKSAGRSNSNNNVINNNNNNNRNNQNPADLHIRNESNNTNKGGDAVGGRNGTGRGGGRGNGGGGGRRGRGGRSTTVGTTTTSETATNPSPSSESTTVNYHSRSYQQSKSRKMDYRKDKQKNAEANRSG